MSHFSDIEIHRWSHDGPGDDGPRMIEHLAVCAECSRRYAAAIRQVPLRAEPADDVSDFVRAGRRVGSRSKLWLIPAIAAAIALFVIAVPFRPRPQEPRTEIRLRGGSIEAIAPDGTAGGDHIDFSWASGIEAARYRIEVGTDDRVLLRATVVRPPFRMPRQWQTTLHPGTEYWWTVTALDAQGASLGESRRRAFAMRQ